MKKFLFLLLPTIPLFSALDFEVGIGPRYDELHWSIAAGGEGPDVLSELEWRDIYSLQVMGTGWFYVGSFAFKCSGAYAEILEGKNFDKDYEADDRREVSDIARAEAGDGKLYDISAGIGWRLASCLSLYSGYSFHRQALTMTDGEVLVPLEQPIFGLDSCYHAMWQGPWVGIELRSTCWRLTCDYHQVIYDGDGFWNLRADFLDKFRHDAYGFGVTGELGFRYPISSIAGVGLLATGQYWRTNPGMGVFPTEEGKIRARLNEVVWTSASLSLTVDACF